MTQHPVMVDHVVADDGRRLALEITGAPDGYPVFLLHGTPGSRKGPKPRGIVLYRLGLQLICYDRPGYGDSDRKVDRTVKDAAADVATIADKFGLARFAVVGRSGGGPHALACAAVMPEQVSHTAVLVPLAPSDAEGLDWYHGMNRQNTREYGTADADAQTLLDNLTTWAERARADPRQFIELLGPELSGPDERVVGDVVFRRLLLDTYAEALRQGPGGWIDDVMAFRRPWMISLEEIVSRVLLWHGADDRFSPVDHTRWLSQRMPKAHVQTRIPSGIGHFGAVEVLPEILSWIANCRDEDIPVATSRRAPTSEGIWRVDDPVDRSSGTQ